MSLDLDWSLLDEELSLRFLETINRALETSASKRPSFIGDIHFSNLQFGSDAPDVSIRSITDIWPDFVSIDEPPLRRKTRHATPASNATTLLESPTETFPPGGGVGVGEIPLRTYTQFDDAAPPHRIHGPASVVGSSVPGTPGVGMSGLGYYQQWSTALASRGIRAASGGAGAGGSLPQAQVTSPIDSVPPSPGYFQHWQQLPYSANNSRQTSFDASSLRGGPGPQSSVSQIGIKRDHSSNSLHPPQPFTRPSLRSTPAASFRSLSGQISPSHVEEQRGGSPSASVSSGLPSLQMHLSLLWPTTTFRLTISTNLLINYPSPAFMSLPLQLSVTGFIMRAGLIVALEGEQHRAHLCLVEEEPESPSDPQIAPGEGAARKHTAGMNILPQLTFESEVGEHEKHVLKNVGKVEKFIAEVIRKGLEDELVYPNYYTVDLPSGRGRS